jgi:hypothetical protein
MYLQKVKQALFSALLLVVLGACGELDTLLPLKGTYQVQAMVNGGTLDECALIRAGDRITPYFERSVDNDPDITGLQILLKNARGEITGPAILYTLNSPTAETNPPGESIVITVEDDAADTTETVAEDDDAPEPENIEAEEPDEPLTETAVPKETYTGGESVRFHVKHLDKNLPYFLLPEDLEIDRYTLVFQVLGEEKIFHTTEKPFYYLRDAEFSLDGIQLFMPGFYSGSRLVPPGTMVMLEAVLKFDPRLDPYIVWYNGKKIISEGSISSGAGRILWKTPEQSGFHAVQAVVFPPQTRQEIAGSAWTLTVPVSSKAENTLGVFGGAVDSIHWYQFAGTLTDSKNPQSSGKALTSADKNPVRWRPMESVYGLMTCAGESYLLPAISFFHNGENQGGGQFLFRINRLSDGAFFSAVIASSDPSRASAEMTLGIRENVLTLKLSSGEAAVELPAHLDSSKKDSMIAAQINFFIRQDRLEAGLVIEKDSPQGAIQYITLTNPPTGTVRFMLGGVTKSESEPKAETVDPAVSNDETPADELYAVDESVPPPAPAANAIAEIVWDELAVCYSAAPLLAEVPETDESPDEPDPETKADSALETDAAIKPKEPVTTEPAAQPPDEPPAPVPAQDTEDTPQNAEVSAPQETAVQDSPDTGAEKPVPETEIIEIAAEEIPPAPLDDL